MTFNSKTLENTALNIATNTAILYGLNETGVGQQVVSAFPGGQIGGAMAGSALIEASKLVKMGLGEFNIIQKQPVRGLDEVAIDFVAQTASIYGLELFGLSDTLSQFTPPGPVGNALQASLLVEAVDMTVSFAKAKGWLSRAENAISGLF